MFFFSIFSIFNIFNLICLTIEIGTVIFIEGWALGILWGWFLVPTIGLPEIGIAQAIGIVIITKFLTRHHTDGATYTCKIKKRNNDATGHTDITEPKTKDNTTMVDTIVTVIMLVVPSVFVTKYSKAMVETVVAATLSAIPCVAVVCFGWIIHAWI